MLSKNKIKEIRSLEKKKFRNEERCFVAEGNKLVADMLSSFDCSTLIAKPSWMATQGDLPVPELIVADDDAIRKVSFLKTPQDVLAVFKMPEWSMDEVDAQSRLILALDGVQDPGNLGTIIRLADWFGIEHIVCSNDTVDVFSPKVVQATMGALNHVEVHYLTLEDYLQQCVAQNIPLYGTFLEGDNIYDADLAQNGVVIMGNEGNGICPTVESLISKKLYIPSYPSDRLTTESLNVAMATAIVCAEFRRRDRGSCAE